MGGVSLLNFCKKQSGREMIIESISDLLKLGSSDDASVLVLGFWDPVLESLMKKKSINHIFFSEESGEAFENIVADFFRTAKKARPGRFDIIFDIGFSQRLQKAKLDNFYRLMRRILRFNGKLMTIAASSRSDYCIRHCPKRLWTYIDGSYIHYFTKEDIRHILSNGFKILEHRQMTIESAKDMQKPADTGVTDCNAYGSCKEIYHKIVSEMVNMKL